MAPSKSARLAEEPSASAAAATAPPPTYNASANDQAVPDGQVPPPQPEQTDTVDVAAAFANLRLSNEPQDPDADTCLAHLKLLFAIQTMKEEIGYTDGLWNIWDSRANSNELDELVVDDTQAAAAVNEAKDPNAGKLVALSKLREKRWALFVARAVDRYEAWWATLPTLGALTERDMETANSPKHSGFVSQPAESIVWNERMLPPLDVLMVWHAHMLNPRSFLEDCILQGVRWFWATGVPWALVNNVIDAEFNYNVSDDCKAAWVAQTGRSWDSVEDPMIKSLRCPACRDVVNIPWTTCGLEDNYQGDQRPGLIGNGYGDGNLLFKCPSCVVCIDKQLLAVSKFCKDTEALLARGRPMPGTVLEPKTGVPEANSSWDPGARHRFPQTFPNRMLKKVLRIQVMELIQPGITPHPTMATVRDLIEQVMSSNGTVRAIDRLDGATVSSRRYPLMPTARIAIRKMMSHYWENFSPFFALDLCGAVMRQGIFAEKMVKIDWLHSPSANKTMWRLLVKYGRFFNIMASYPTQTVVPTLDVDLAWHTHQLNPKAYYAHCIKTASKFIDHDDKIEEEKLSDCFEWTSKKYQDTYGEVYSECTCWYCETVRSAHISTLKMALGVSKQEKVAESFHTSGAASLCPPDQSAHISSHNAVRGFEDPSVSFNAADRVRAHMASLHRQRLAAAHAKAQRRAAKKGRQIPPREEYYSHWGYPYAAYGPYMYPLWFAPGMYYGWAPGYVAACGAGSWGSCAAGSCGGGVAAGACGGAGGCGASGACGGGGGGGGGCGGGGGGGGCGGGGGGGGCGGGGGG